MTEEERLEKRKKTGTRLQSVVSILLLTLLVLYLRHRLQKGFLTRTQEPKEEDMSAMSGYMTQLEELQALEPDIIRETKVHRVLKGILKLDFIPQDLEFNIKQRSQDLLNKWNGVLSSGKDAADETAAPATNGVKPEEKKPEEPATESKEDATTTAEEAKPKDADGDVTMADSTEQSKENKDDAAVAETNGDAESEKVADTVETAA